MKLSLGPLPQRSDNDKLSITLPAGDVASLCREALAVIGPTATEYANARGEWFDLVLQQADVLREIDEAKEKEEREAFRVAVGEYQKELLVWHAKATLFGRLFNLAGPPPVEPTRPLSCSMLSRGSSLLCGDPYFYKAEFELSDSKPREPIGYRDVEPLERMAEAAEALGGEMTIKFDWVQVLQRATVYAGRVSG
jgi:hypothetical protein